MYDHEKAHRVPSIHVPLERKLGYKIRFGRGRDIDGLWEPEKTDRHHPLTTVCRREVLVCL